MREGHWYVYESFNENDFGFIYSITNLLTSKSYIGKRNLSNVNGGWRTYTSSSKDLNKDIKELGITNFEFLILFTCPDRDSLALAEIELQTKLDVLNATDPQGLRSFYNKNIGAVKFNTCGRVWTEQEKQTHNKDKVGVTWEAIHGKEKSDLLKQSASERQIAKNKSRAGKTYDQLYDKETADRRREELSLKALGKTYEQIHGVEEAIALKKIRSDMAKKQLTGKTYEEIYGIEGSKAKRLKSSISMKKVRAAKSLARTLEETHSLLQFHPDPLSL